MPDLDFESQFDLQFNAGIPAGHTNEFIFDSDEGSPLPNRPGSASADSCHAMPDAPQDYGPPSEALGLVSNSSSSLESSYESTFDSESSKRASASSAASTKLGMGDFPMADGPGVKPDWDMADLLNGSAADGFPMMHDNFDFSSASAAVHSDLRSPTDSPSPFTPGVHSLSPDATSVHDMATSRASASPAGDADLAFRTACDDALAVSFLSLPAARCSRVTALTVACLLMHPLPPQSPSPSNRLARECSPTSRPGLPRSPPRRCLCVLPRCYQPLP